MNACAACILAVLLVNHPQCGHQSNIITDLSERYGEAVRDWFVDKEGFAVELWFNNVTGTWTVTKDILAVRCASPRWEHGQVWRSRGLIKSRSVAKFLEVGGLPAGYNVLKTIGRISLRGLDPLISDVRNR